MAHLTYNCDACRTSIPPLNPRVHCLDPACPDYDLCANCALGERATPPHAPGHRTKVFRTAGGGGVAMTEGRWYVHASAAAPPPTYDYGVTPPPQGSVAPVAPPPLPNRRSSSTANANARSLSQGQGQSQGPISPTQSSPLTGWQPFFNADSSPSPMFITLMNDIFTYLDPTNLGNLVPETFSRFLDDMGYLPHENACKC